MSLLLLAFLALFRTLLFLTLLILLLLLPLRPDAVLFVDCAAIVDLGVEDLVCLRRLQLELPLNGPNDRLSHGALGQLCRPATLPVWENVDYLCVRQQWRY